MRHDDFNGHAPFPTQPLHVIAPSMPNVQRAIADLGPGHIPEGTFSTLAAQVLGGTNDPAAAMGASSVLSARTRNCVATMYPITFNSTANVAPGTMVAWYQQIVPQNLSRKAFQIGGGSSAPSAAALNAGTWPSPWSGAIVIGGTTFEVNWYYTWQPGPLTQQFLVGGAQIIPVLTNMFYGPGSNGGQNFFYNLPPTNPLTILVTAANFAGPAAPPPGFRGIFMEGS